MRQVSLPDPQPKQPQKGQMKQPGKEPLTTNSENSSRSGGLEDRDHRATSHGALRADSWSWSQLLSTGIMFLLRLKLTDRAHNYLGPIQGNWGLNKQTWYLKRVVSNQNQ